MAALDSSRQWELFGYDMSQLGKRWFSAWRDFLWSGDSPVRSRLDEVVRLRDGDSVRYFHSEREVAAQDTDCEALLLPAELVLTRTVEVPRAAEAEIDAVMALEVSASSPFPANDTAAGWRIEGRDESTLQVQLAIASVSAVMAWVAREFGSHDPHAREVWGPTDSVPVVMHGFGERRRQTLYYRRLRRVTALWCGAAAILLVVFALAAAAKYQELDQVSARYDELQREAATASATRESLTLANAMLQKVDEVLALHPSPHRELARLTELLRDDAFLTSFRMTGPTIEIRGRAADAANLLERLIEVPEYSEVQARSAFTAAAGGTEQFFLSLRRVEEEPQ